MPTVIDSLVLELGLDPSKFTAGQAAAMGSLRKMEEVALASGRSVESQSKKILELLSAFRREAVGALAIFFGGRGISEFINFITTLDAATGRLARTMDMSSRDVSAWQGAFAQIGGNAESANGALAGLSGEMSRFQLTGQSAMLPVLSRLGVSLYDQNRHLKTSGELWLDLADAVSGMDPRQAVEFLKMIPGANQDMINFALLGRRAMEERLRFNAAMAPTPEEVKAAEDYQKAMAGIDRSATNLGRTLVNWLAPSLVTVMDKMTELFRIWNTSPESKEGKAIVEGNRQGLSDRFGSPRDLVEFFSHSWAEQLYGPQASSGNMTNFLSGLSYLESSQTNAQRTARHFASGFFQFQPATAARARSAGLADPRAGGYSEQSAATEAYIRHFYPNAGHAIDQGDFGPAIAILKGEWPSLPGGGQAQSAARYQIFDKELRGGGPRAGGATTVNVGGVVVNTTASDGTGIAQEIAPALKRSLSAGAANTGAQ